MGSGYFKIKIGKEAINKKLLKLIGKMFPIDEIETVSLSVKLKRPPTQIEISKLTDILDKGVDIDQVKATWIDTTAKTKETKETKETPE